MSNIKWTYWMPFFGVAFIRRDVGSRLNSREERLLVLYHMGVYAGVFLLGILLLKGF